MPVLPSDRLSGMHNLHRTGCTGTEVAVVVSEAVGRLAEVAGSRHTVAVADKAEQQEQQVVWPEQNVERQLRSRSLRKHLLRLVVQGQCIRHHLDLGPVVSG